MKDKEQAMVAYEPPKVEVIEVLVEQGFAASTASAEPTDYEFGGVL